MLIAVPMFTPGVTPCATPAGCWPRGRDMVTAGSPTSAGLQHIARYVYEIILNANTRCRFDLAVLDVVQENCDGKTGVYRGFNGQRGSQDTISRVGYIGRGLCGPHDIVQPHGARIIPYDIVPTGPMHHARALRPRIVAAGLCVANTRILC